MSQLFLLTLVVLTEPLNISIWIQNRIIIMILFRTLEIKYCLGIKAANNIVNNIYG